MAKSKETYLIIPLLACAGLFVAAVLYAGNLEAAAHQVLLITLLVGTVPLLWRMVTDIFRGHFGIDIIALSAIITSYVLGEYLAGTVIVIMLSGGEALEDYAKNRARQELSHLLSRAPSLAHKKVGEEILDVPAGRIGPGDVVVVKTGEILPVDGVVLEGESTIDESAITGESLPVEKYPSSLVVSGSINEGGLLEVRATKSSGQSKYQQIVRLVKQAENSRSPMVRMADEYSVYFTAITFIMAAGSWFLFKDPGRLLAVLVVATPCPLILATPIAIISGMSRAASRGIIVKSGGALERLGKATAFVFDKTGTLTVGVPQVHEVVSFGFAQAEILRLAASLDQLSAHILARSLVDFAKKGNAGHLAYPENFQELLGQGVEGIIDGHSYHFGKLAFLKRHGIGISDEIEKRHARSQERGIISVYLAQDKQCGGAVLFTDTIRAEDKELFASMRHLGVQKIVMLTGDKQSVAADVAKKIGINTFVAECLPEDKVTQIKNLQKRYDVVAMVGDGINDAPALATADVGVALGSHGGTASSDAGDIVIMVDTLRRVSEAMAIAKRSLRVAKEGILFGIGMSVLLMAIAALGHIRPVAGALIQEALDVIVILNALRVSINK